MILLNRKLNYRKPWRYPDIFIFCGNPTRNENGALQMDRGPAKEIATAYPGIDKKIKTNEGLTFVLVHDITSKQSIIQMLGYFEIKESKEADINLDKIKRNIRELEISAKDLVKARFHMNCPRVISNDKEIIKEFEVLPDNVILYK